MGPWWTVLVAVPVIGTQYYALTIIGHDGVHRRLASKRWRNDLLADLAIYSPVGLISRINGRNHLRHHALLGTREDPDRYKYQSVGRETRTRLVLSFLNPLFLRNQVRNVVVAGVEGAGLEKPPATTRERRGYTVRDGVILVLGQVLLIGGLTWAFGWWGWPVLWLLPVAVFMFGGDMLRSYCEHSHPTDVDDEEHRLISYVSSPVERIFFAPHNMNMHVAHHLYVSIPYYNLPKADRLLRERAADTHLTWRRSYVGHLLGMFRALPTELSDQVSRRAA